MASHMADTCCDLKGSQKATKAREKKATASNLASYVVIPLDVIVRTTNESTSEQKTSSPRGEVQCTVGIQ